MKRESIRNIFERTAKAQSYIECEERPLPNCKKAHELMCHTLMTLAREYSDDVRNGFEDYQILFDKFVARVPSGLPADIRAFVIAEISDALWGSPVVMEQSKETPQQVHLDLCCFAPQGVLFEMEAR